MQHNKEKVCCECDVKLIHNGWVASVHTSNEQSGPISLGSSVSLLLCTSRTSNRVRSVHINSTKIIEHDQSAGELCKGLRREERRHTAYCGRKRLQYVLGENESGEGRQLADLERQGCDLIVRQIAPRQLAQLAEGRR